MALLSDYQADTRELLRDQQGLFVSTHQLNRWINQARRKVAEITGCLRQQLTGQAPYGSGAQPGSAVPGSFVPGMLPNAAANASLATPTNLFQTVSGQEMYPFSWASIYLRNQYRGYGYIYDVMDVSVSWGGIMPSLNWVPWDELQAYARSYNVGVTSYPFAWATNGDGQAQNLWLFPIPTQALIMEWDCFCGPADLNSDADYDVIMHPFTSAVKFYAAALCFYSSQRPGSAQIMLDQFGSTLGIGRLASDRGKVPDYYFMYNP